MGLSEFEKLCRKRLVTKNKLSALLVKTAAVNLSIQQLKLYRDQVEQYWQEANGTLNEMSSIAKEDELGQIQTDFEEVEKIFDEQRLKLATLIDTASASAPSKDVKLPKLELPSFSGQPENWLSFHDLFLASVHNNSTLTGSQKLQYLKAALKGDAARLIQSSVITDTSYGDAWDRVVKRFHNKREIVNAVIKKLMSQPAISAESPVALRQLVDNTNELVSSLSVLKRPVEHWDDILVYSVVQKLDSESRRHWELSLEDEEPPKFSKLMEFLEQRSRALISLETSKAKPSTSKPSNTKPSVSSNVVNSPKNCLLCNEDHPIFRCSKYQSQSTESRIKTIKSHNLCYNCLRKGHGTSNCNNARRCQTCKGKHHTSIHADDKPDTSTPTTTVAALASNTHYIQQVLLATAIVKVSDGNGRKQLCRALIDPGSQTSFIKEACAQRLNLPRSRAHVNVSGFAAVKAGTTRGSLTIQVHSCIPPQFSIQLQAFIMHKVTADMPTFPPEKHSWHHLESLPLADPHYYRCGTIDILLGADIFGTIIRNGIKHDSQDSPTALNTALGWVVLGPTTTTTTSITSLVVQNSLDSQLEKFWKLEELPSQSLLTEEERLCEESFQLTHTRESSGRYVVELPFQPNHLPLGNSYDQAHQRFLQLERQLQRNTERKELYCRFMEEYEQLGHMVQIPQESLNLHHTDHYYLPHHAVFKWSSTTTKCRVVFDASAQTTSGISLNDILLCGPTVQDALFTHLLRFRCHLVPFVADIEKMYRMVAVNKKHWDYQRILWREDPTKPIRHYWLLVLTFGTKSAPFLAVRALRQCAEDHRKSHPLAYQIVMNDFYVDNMMSGQSTAPKAIEAASQLNTMLALGNFNLREWFSHDDTLLQSVPAHLRGLTKLLPLDEKESVATLGLRWHVAFDNFKYNVTRLHRHPKTTKRTLASDIATLYDPLGWLSPVTVLPKDLIRRVWQLKLAWDAEVPDVIGQDWEKFRLNLSVIQDLHIPRCITRPTAITHQLCGFSDASERAYAACVYVRVVTPDSIYVDLLTAKSKIAPVSQRSIPRLELCGALLLVRLMNTVKTSLPIQFSEFHAWTDSKVVLAWLHSHPRRWSTFIANRVAVIQDEASHTKWHHVSSTENPADVASRGISPQDLSKDDLWWHGPSFLLNALPETEETLIETPDRALEEERATARVHTVNVDDPLLRKFSSLTTLCRVTAYVLRYISNLKRKYRKRLGFPEEETPARTLSTKDIRAGLEIWIKSTQEVSFPSELKALKKGRPLPSDSSLITLNPYVDSKGVIRVGGRLNQANIAGDHKNPTVLPRNHSITALIIRSEHLRLLHAGPQAVIASLSTRFWILNARDAVRKCTRSCIICVRLRAEVAKQMMGNLPKSRVTPVRPFHQAGVDYAGPFTLRVLRGRGQRHYKGYLALFVCFSTRSIHLELVSELTSAAFIAALKRFVSRRGRPHTIHSDNGTNFVGANRELREFERTVRGISQEDPVTRHVSNEGINWKFIPPGAPHFGGLWEAGVKSVKFHLRRVIGDNALDFEEMSTVLTQVEACLNSRPLCQLSSDPADLSVLTPAHFLIGESITAIPEEDYTTVPINRLSRWNLAQRIVQHFWKRWSSEFLSRLQQRPKWWARKPNLKVGDLVLVKEEQKSPLKWRLGRVEELHPGSDDLVRVVTLRMKEGTFKRPVQKLCPLPIDGQEDSEEGKEVSATAEESVV